MDRVLTLAEQKQDRASFDRSLVVRGEHTWVGLRITSETIGLPKSEAIILTFEQADQLEDFLARQRIAREASGRGAR